MLAAMRRFQIDDCDPVMTAFIWLEDGLTPVGLSPHSELLCECLHLEASLAAGAWCVLGMPELHNICESMGFLMPCCRLALMLGYSNTGREAKKGGAEGTCPVGTTPRGRAGFSPLALRLGS